MLIGTFTKNESGEFEGRIATLTIEAYIKLEPVAQKTKDRAPDYRIVSVDHEAEIGGAWNEISKDRNPYLSCKIDDPALPDTIWTNLTKGENETYNLFWDRRKAKVAPTGENAL